MQNNDSLINEFSSFIPFVQSLRELDENNWAAPIAEGKWTIRDIIAHIMLWDKYFLEEAVEKIASHQQVTTRHLDYNEFNRQAVEYAKGKSKQEIVEMTVHNREEILRHLKELSEEEFTKVHLDGDGHKFAANYYVKDFIEHDEHHVKQIKALLGAI